MTDLKQWRSVHGKMSQAKLAMLVNTTQPHLSAIENGEDNISLELCARIFTETGVRVGRLKDATAKQARAIVDLTAASQPERAAQ